MKAFFSLIILISFASLFSVTLSWSRCNEDFGCPNNFNCLECNGRIGCCTFKNGVCCGDKCCPEGSTCVMGTNSYCITPLKSNFLQQEKIEAAPLSDPYHDYLKDFLNGFFSEMRSHHPSDFTRITQCVDNALQGNTDVRNLINTIRQKEQTLDSVIGIFHQSAGVVRDISNVLLDCEISLVSVSRYTYEFIKLFIEEPVEILKLIYENTIHNIPRLAIHAVEVQDLFQNKGYYYTAGIFAAKIYNIVIDNFPQTLKANRAISFLQTSDIPNLTAQPDKNRCTQITYDVVNNVNELIAQSQSNETSNQVGVSLISKLHSLYTTYNKECIDLSQKFSVPVVELRTIYLFGLGEHSSNEDNSIEVNFIQNCRDRIDSFISTIEKGFVGMNDLNSLHVTIAQFQELRSKVQNMRRENTICNTLIDRVSTHFKYPNPSIVSSITPETKGQCELIAKKAALSVSELISRAEEEIYNQKLMVGITNQIYGLHLSYNRQCIDLSEKFSLPRYDLKDLYYIGLSSTGFRDNATVGTYVSNCKSRIDAMVDIAEKGEAGFENLNNFSLIMASHSELRQTIAKQRQENTICNGLISRVFRELNSSN